MSPGDVNINAGTLKLVGSGNYSTSGTVHLASGATLDATGLIGGPRFGGDPTTRTAVNDGDTLTGTGTVNGGLKVKSGGTVYPGVNGVGTLTVGGKGLFEAGSNWKVKLSTANAGGSNTSNRINFDAELQLENGVNMAIDGNGLTFAAGQTYEYVISMGASNYNIGAVNFQPTNFNPSGLASPSSFSLIPSGSNLILRFTPVPEPALVMALFLGGAAGYGALRRRRAGSGPPRPAPA
jgi:hypothetical protein